MCLLLSQLARMIQFLQNGIAPIFVWDFSQLGRWVGCWMYLRVHGSLLNRHYSKASSCHLSFEIASPASCSKFKTMCREELWQKKSKSTLRLSVWGVLQRKTTRTKRWCDATWRNVACARYARRAHKRRIGIKSRLHAYKVQFAGFCTASSLKMMMSPAEKRPNFF